MNPSTRRTSPTSIAPMTRRHLRALHKTEAQPEMQIAAAAVVAAVDVDPAVVEARAAAVSRELGYAERVALLIYALSAHGRVSRVVPAVGLRVDPDIVPACAAAASRSRAPIRNQRRASVALGHSPSSMA